MIRALIFMLINHIRFSLMLKKCLVIENVDNVELFEYKGKAYDRKKFIQIKAESLCDDMNMSKKVLEKHLDNYESNLVKSKNPDLDTAIIEAYKIAISQA